MEWLNIIGGSLAFIGSVIVSADLVQSKRYADAQNKTYFDNNPFTVRSRKTNLIGFTLIVTGFATTLSVDLSRAAYLDLPSTFWLLGGLITAGVLCIYLIYRMNERTYDALEAGRRRKIFNSSVFNMAKKFKNIIGSHNEDELFPLYKEGDLKQLSDNYARLNESQKDKNVQEVYAQLGEAVSAQAITDIANKYAQKINSRN